jgi:UDP-GlcNAc:undecaprenyl-phosphate/decaprenyl-phosphate GlcNAc-1-phosphate transferase
VITLCLALAAASFTLSLALCLIVEAVSRRASAFDTPPIPGQLKAPTRRVPNTGGIGVFWAITLPIICALLAAHLAPDLVSRLAPAAAVHLEGVREQTLLAVALLVSLFALHVLGVIDDRRPLGPMLKLSVMLAPALLIATVGETRLFTALDGLTGSTVPSLIVTLLWFLIVTNAMNFIDNMDGLCAGVASVASAFFLAGALLSGQWFVAASLALLLGASGGFLVRNRPPAKLFLGDGGSLVIGFLLAFLTIRGTYVPQRAGGADVSGAWADNWFAALTPLVILAVPLYDFATVTFIRLRAGKSPFVGDLNHLSHRLVRRGLSQPGAVACILLLTSATGFSGLLLRGASAFGAVLIGAQVVCILAVVARLEFGSAAR